MPERLLQLVHSVHSKPNVSFRNSRKPQQFSDKLPIPPPNRRIVSPTWRETLSTASLGNKMQWLAATHPFVLQTFDKMIDTVIEKHIRDGGEPPDLASPSPVEPESDLTYEIDRQTLEYVGYHEHTPGTMIIPSCNLLHRRMGDVAPEVADLFDRAIWTATKSGIPQQVSYRLRGHNRRATVDVIGSIANIAVNEV